MSDQKSSIHLPEDLSSADLSEALRYLPDPDVRIAAATAIAKRNDLDCAEDLMRSILEDPEERVQKASSAALEEMLGPQRAAEALAVFAGNPQEQDEWLIDVDLYWLKGGPVIDPERIELTVENAEFSPEWLLDSDDPEAVILALRYGADAEIRCKAAEILGETGDIDHVESLMRSCIEDRDEDVRRVAREALDDLLGPDRAKEALSVQQSVEPEDDWLLSREEVSALLSPEAQKDQMWTREQRSSLLTIALHDNNPEKRIKAIYALDEIGDTYVMDALIAIVTQSRDKPVVEAARKILEKYYGEETDAVIAQYHTQSDFDEDDFEEDEIDEEAEEDEAQEGEPAAENKPLQPSAITPSSGGCLGVFLLAIVALGGFLLIL